LITSDDGAVMQEVGSRLVYYTYLLIEFGLVFHADALHLSLSGRASVGAAVALVGVVSVVAGGSTIWWSQVGR
jgi:hypothetical protein